VSVQDLELLACCISLAASAPRSAAVSSRLLRSGSAAPPLLRQGSGRGQAQGAAAGSSRRLASTAAAVAAAAAAATADEMPCRPRIRLTDKRRLLDPTSMSMAAFGSDASQGEGPSC
jgi:hypothetical protein